MDYYIVLTFLCMLTTQAHCGTLRKGRDTRAVNKTIRMMHREIQTLQNTLKNMTDSGKLPNTPCMSENYTELVGAGPTLTALHLSTFGCHMQEMSALVQKRMSLCLLKISQLAQDVSQLNDPKPCLDCCSLPSFEEDPERYVHVKCLLEIMDRRLNTTTYNVTS